MKVFENEYMTINMVDNEQTLELDWKQQTSQMQAADFKAALYIYAGFSIEFMTPQLLVLIHLFGFQEAMSQELTEWRDQQIFPKYNQAGVQKMAFLGNKEQLPPQDPPQSALANFPTRFFSDKNDVAVWFNG